MTSAVKENVLKHPTWWNRRTKLEQCLSITTGVVVLVGLSLLVALATVLVNNSKNYRSQTINSSYNAEALQRSGVIVNTNRKRDVDTEGVCSTPGCIQTASKVLEYMDPLVNPCDDFFHFACGKFIKNTKIPDDKTSVTSFTLLIDALQEQLRTIIEEPVKPNELKPFQLTKKLYRACMNKTIIEKDGLTTIHQILKDLGGWPVLEADNWIGGDFNWTKSVYRLRKYGYSVDYLIEFTVGIDLKNSSKRIIELDQPSFGLKREFLTKGLSDKLVKAYFDYMVDIAVLFGADRGRAGKELEESLNFEIKLANISLPNEERRNATALYNPMTIDELQKRYQSVPWFEYINTILGPDTNVSMNEVVVICVPTYMANLEKLLKITPKRVQANYLMWRAAYYSVSYLTEALKQRQLQYTTVVTGRTQRAPRWKECVDISSGSLGTALGALYVRKYFNENARQIAQEMVREIRMEFENNLNKLDWMDESTRKNAISKAKSMSTHIAYPDELLDDNKLEEFYENLELDENNFMRSMLNLTLFETRYSLNLLKQPVIKNDWITHGKPAVVNAYYSSIENSIHFPAGILQGVFFGADRPRYMNYGAIGYVIGHEITHGFDDVGRQFDKDGNLVDWWALSTQKAFEEKAQCIIDQYGNFTVPEVNLTLNGINTQGENIADNGGIKESYLAYNSWTKKHGTEKQLPGLDYTPQQMFWISSGNMWCSTYRPQSMKLRVLTGFHSPEIFRVHGTLGNLNYFANDFNCPLGSKMNPKKKCKVW